MSFKLARALTNIDKCQLESDDSDSDGPSGDEFDAVCRDKRHRERKREAKLKRAADTAAADSAAKIGNFYGAAAEDKQ